MAFDNVERAIAAIAAGQMVILVDDEDRENEGDLTLAADKVTPEAINFMATHGRGLICLTLTGERLEALQIPMMVADNTSSFRTAFTVSIEARHGVSTGISAADRAHTIRTAVDPSSGPADLARPGHIFPLRAQAGGVLVRTGQTEGSVDLARLAGLSPAGVICEVMNDDGTMARRDDLRAFGARHGMPMVSIAELIEYRLAHETLVRRLASRTVDHPRHGRGTLHVFGTVLDERQHLAWVKGDVAVEDDPNVPAPLVRVQAGQHVGEVFDELAHAAPGPYGAIADRLAQEPRAVWLCLDAGPTDRSLQQRLAELDAPAAPPSEQSLRQVGIGAQILRALGLQRLRLLAAQPRRVVGLEGYGLHVDGVVSLDASLPADKDTSP